MQCAVGTNISLKKRDFAKADSLASGCNLWYNIYSSVYFRKERSHENLNKGQICTADAD